MEKKKLVKKSKENNEKKRNYPKVIGEFLDFYKKDLRKKHIIVYVISLIIFFIFLAMFISSLDVTTSIATLAENAQENVNNSNVFIQIFKQTLPSIFLVIFAGITPFVYLSVIGFYYPYILAGDISSSFLITSHTGSLICMTIGAIIQIFAMSLAMVAGFYYCTISSKKFRYSQRSGFGLYNVKKQIYEIRKDEKKLAKLEEKKRKKDEKIESLNVSVPYRKLLYVFIVTFVIAVIGTLIAAI